MRFNTFVTCTLGLIRGLFVFFGVSLNLPRVVQQPVEVDTARDEEAALPMRNARVDL